MGSQCFRRYPVIAALFFVLGCSTPTAPSSRIIPDGSSASTEAQTDLKSAVTSSLSPLEYDSGDDTTKSLISSYRPGNLYIALRVNSTGFDPNNNNQFECSDTSIWHFFKKFVLVHNKTFTLDATFNVGGFQLPTIPIMVLSDVEGMCKFYSIPSKRVVPLTRVDGSSIISVKYTLKWTDSTSFTLFDSIKPSSTTLPHFPIKAFVLHL
jgi:hypothetical protein